QAKLRAHVHGADDAEVVVEPDGGRRDADDPEPRPAAVDRGREDEELPEEATGEREAGEAEHEREHRRPEQRPLPAHPREIVERDRLAELPLTRRDDGEGAE